MHRYTKVITMSEREKNHYQNSRLFKLKTHEMKFKASDLCILMTLM